uniref:Uncharacterized protein n=1 Tax=viral metagenome TaxID=1070528 RepID=A0A6M3JCF5_9ZZZZ
MPIFKLKPGPIIRPSRILHFTEGAVAATAGLILGGDHGMTIGGVAVVIGGMGWEVSNRFMPGEHQYADMWDWLFFVAGPLVVGAVRSIF